MRTLDRFSFGCRVAAIAFVLIIITGNPVYPQTPDPSVSERLKRIEDGLQELQKRVGELTSILRAILPPSPIAEIKNVQVPTRGAVKGSTSARIVVIEFSDFACPFCGRHAATVFRELERNYIDTGKIQYEFRHLPLEQIHPMARTLAEASECAADQGKFWQMHDRLFEHQKSLKAEDLVNHARSAGVDETRFRLCIANKDAVSRVDSDLAEARKFGLTSTPTFLVGEKGSDGTITVLKRISGAHPFQTFQATIEPLLAQRISP
jgi:protein-disulfide isomerase